MKTAFAIAIAAAAAGLVIAAACSSTPVITVGATFQSPSAVAVTLTLHVGAMLSTNVPRAEAWGSAG